MLEPEEKKPSIQPIKTLKQYIKSLGTANRYLLDYLEATNECEEDKVGRLGRILNYFETNPFISKKIEFKTILETIALLSIERRSIKEIMERVEEIMIMLKCFIKNTFSEEEIYDIFIQNPNKLIFIILQDQKLLSIDTIIQKNNPILMKIFYPEIRNNDEKKFQEYLEKNIWLKGFVNENDQNLEVFYENRAQKSNVSDIITIFREDKVNDFISIMENYNVDLNDKISVSSTFYPTDYIGEFAYSPIKFAVLFGSIHIFKYLILKDSDIENPKSIIKNAIQGGNYEIIHILEGNEIIQQELKQPDCQQALLYTAIKCHRNDLFDYLVLQYGFGFKKEYIEKILFYHNNDLFYRLIKAEEINLHDPDILNILFYKFCTEGNDDMVELLISLPEIKLNEKDQI